MKRPVSISSLRRLGEETASGLRRRDLEKLFEQDAGRAFAILTADVRNPEEERGKGDLRRLLLRTKWFFVGLTSKLSPARRVLFATSLLLPLLGLATLEGRIGPVNLHVDFSPLWFLSAMAGLVLLLALELGDRVEVRDELEIARELQRELLPQGELRLPGYQAAHSYRTANSIGGDYYDFLRLPDGRVALALGDASGHGLAAGLLMAIASATLRTAVDLDPRPEAVLGMLNRTLFRTGGRRAFMTLAYAVLDPDSGQLDVAVAGHPFPLLRSASGEVRELGSGGFPLGISDRGSWPVVRAVLGHGDLLMIYSDGIPEALGENGEPFGFERLGELLSRGGTPRAIHDRVLDAFDRHRGEVPVRDDLSLVLLDRSPPLPGAAP